MIRHRHRGDNLEIVLVAIDKYVVLYLVVSLHGIIVHLLEALRYALVVLVVLLHRGAHVGEIAAQGCSVGKARLAVGLTCLVEHEGQLSLLAVLVEHEFRSLCLAVLDVLLHLERRWNVAQRLHKILIACYLCVHTLHDAVVGHASLAELAIQFGGFMACVCHVEREVLLLRVEHQRNLVAALHERNHLLVLLLVVHGIARHVLALFAERCLQFGTKHRECRLQIFLLQHSTGVYCHA